MLELFLFFVLSEGQRFFKLRFLFFEFLLLYLVFILNLSS